MHPPPGSAGAAPVELSLLIPTYARPDLVASLLTRLEAQTLDASRFEVILVDDGSPQPLQVDALQHAFAITLLRQDNAGPAAARNLGLTRCRGPLTLILNDDAVPAPNLLAAHLAAHARSEREVAVLGSFAFTAEAARRPFVQILAGSDLLFDFPGLRADTPLPWTFFWTCNLSLPTQVLRSAGGFDAELFREAIVEDVELGYRLEARGVPVVYAPEAVAEHAHELSPTSYFKRAVRLGVNLARMHAKHADLRSQETWNRETRASMQATCETLHAPSLKLIEKLERLDAEPGKVLAGSELELLRRLVGRLSTPWVHAGMLLEQEGRNPHAALLHGPPPGVLTSIVVVTRDALDQTRRCLEALRRCADPRHPTELICVDNGSTDGTAEYLERQDDLTLLRNTENRGAPAARNQALPLTRGEQVVFMDSDVMVTDGWLRRMLFHAAVDARSGCVGCLSDRAAHGQQLAYPGANTPAAINAFATARSRECERQFRFQPMLTSFLLLVRREVLEVIGGFDERFSPWGFEDDDFSLRAHLAGFRNRVALDVFVRHEGYGGTKAATHAGLLERNWIAFATKWGAPDAFYGDYASLEPELRGEFPRERLHVALTAAESPTCIA